MTQHKTVKDLDLTPDEEKRLMTIMQVGFVPPDMPADMARQMLEASAPRNFASARPQGASAAAAPAPSQAWATWTKVRGPLIVAAIGALVLWAGSGQ